MKSIEQILLLADARELSASGKGITIRERAGLSQSELAGAIGVTPSAICRWESRGRRPFGKAGARYAQVLRLLESRIADASSTLETTAPSSSPGTGTVEKSSRDRVYPASAKG